MATRMPRKSGGSERKPELERDHRVDQRPAGRVARDSLEHHPSSHRSACGFFAPDMRHLTARCSLLPSRDAAPRPVTDLAKLRARVFLHGRSVTSLLLLGFGFILLIPTWLVLPPDDENLSKEILSTVFQSRQLFSGH